jgi:hypothetical protein
VVTELGWLKTKVNNMFIENEWLLVGRGENKVTSLKLTKLDFIAAYLDNSVLF